MKKKVLLMLVSLFAATVISGCADVAVNVTPSDADPEKETAEEVEEEVGEIAADDQALADEVAALIDAIYVQERNSDTDAQCELAKQKWDALTDEQKELVEGEEADPDYFGRDTGDASKDDPLNADGIGDKEILVVSFGTSFNDSRVQDIGGIEKAIADTKEAYYGALQKADKGWHDEKNDPKHLFDDSVRQQGRHSENDKKNK